MESNPRTRPPAHRTTPLGAALGLAAAVVAAAALAETRSPAQQPDGGAPPSIDYGQVRELMSPEKKVRRRAARALRDDPRPAWIPVVVDALFFIPSAARDEALDVLERLTGEKRGRRYLDWVELVGAREDLELPDGYRGWKRSLLQRIDPRFGAMLPDDAAARIRIEELVWGGVRVEGIPALERPPKVSAQEALFMRPGDRVFGLSLEGRHHAYPVKVLSWRCSRARPCRPA